MGYFKDISFNNFRNFSNFSIDFSNKCNVFFGKNGSGKTNILEGISLFEKGRGFRKEKIENLINHQNFNRKFNIYSNFENEENNYNINITNSETNTKKLSVNNSYEKNSLKYFESLFSIIYFLPEMERIFVSSPSLRRNFLDRLIFNFNKNYNMVINNYQKTINERKLLLKKINYDENWMLKIENNIVKFGTIIYHERISHIDTINNILKEIKLTKHVFNNFILKVEDNFLAKDLNISSNKEIYLSEIKKRRERDFFSGGCSIGPHRSDIVGFNVKNNFNLNQLSTGQQKTIVLLIIIRTDVNI